MKLLIIVNIITTLICGVIKLNSTEPQDAIGWGCALCGWIIAFKYELECKH